MKFSKIPILALLVTFSPVWAEKEDRDLSHHGGRHGGGGHHGGGGYGHQDHGGGYGHSDPHGGYKPSHPKKCHPQTITKYKTIHKDRKANVVNQVEFLNPLPHVKKVTETRYTTIRYPVFITQVIKPLLTQVETKVKPVFFTKTIDKYTTVLFTVTGIGQVTVTTVKYEKEYITRCMKKGYHRSYAADEGPQVKEQEIPLPQETKQYGTDSTDIPPPPGIPYESSRSSPRIAVPYPQGPAEVNPPSSSYPRRRRPSRRPPHSSRPPLSPISPLFRNRNRNLKRKGQPSRGNVEDLYYGDLYYQQGRPGRELEMSSLEDMLETVLEAHPPLVDIPLEIIV